MANVSRVRATLLPAALCALVCACAGDAPTAIGGRASAPAGTAQVFALMDPGDSCATLRRYAALSTVDGLAFRVRWSTLQPSTRTYDWDALDSAFAIVGRVGKKLTVDVAAFGSNGSGSPGWLRARTYGFTDPSGSYTLPVPWDSTYISAYTRFVAALGAHIRNTGDANRLEAVSDAVPFSEMTIPGCLNGQLGGTVAYDRDLYLTAWENTVDAELDAFPGVRLFISAPLSFICANDGNDGEAFYTALMSHALARSPFAAVFAADLDAQGSTRMQQVSSTIADEAAIGLQTIWSATDDPTDRMHRSLADAVCRGWGLGARYFELYKEDVSSADSATEAAVAQAHDGAGY